MAKGEVFSTGFIFVFFSSLAIILLAGVFAAILKTALIKCCVASINLEFGAIMARRQNQSRVSAVVQLTLIAIKFGTADARRLFQRGSRWFFCGLYILVALEFVVEGGSLENREPTTNSTHT